MHNVLKQSVENVLAVLSMIQSVLLCTCSEHYGMHLHIIFFISTVNIQPATLSHFNPSSLCKYLFNINLTETQSAWSDATSQHIHPELVGTSHP